MSSDEEITPQFKEKNRRPLPKTGKLPVKDLFNAIIETIDSPEVREIAHEELEESKINLESALKQLDSIAKKMKQPKQSRR